MICVTICVQTDCFSTAQIAYALHGSVSLDQSSYGHIRTPNNMAGHASKLTHFLWPPKYIIMHSDVLNIHFRLFPSLHSDLEHGKVVFRDFLSILVQIVRCSLFFLI
jgi:hypothetical protein